MQLDQLFKAEPYGLIAQEARTEVQEMTTVYDLYRELGWKGSLEQGLEQGVLRGQRELVLETLTMRFGVVPSGAAERLERMTDPALLREVLRRVLTASTLTETGLADD